MARLPSQRLPKGSSQDSPKSRRSAQSSNLRELAVFAAPNPVLADSGVYTAILVAVVDSDGARPDVVAADTAVTITSSDTAVGTVVSQATNQSRSRVRRREHHLHLSRGQHSNHGLCPGTSVWTGVRIGFRAYPGLGRGEPSSEHHISGRRDLLARFPSASRTRSVTQQWPRTT